MAANQLRNKYILYFLNAQAVVHYLGYQIFNYQILALFLQDIPPNMNIRAYYFPLVVLLIVFQGCKKDSGDDNVPVQTGKINGELKLTDEFGIELTNHSGMTVIATGGRTGVTTAAGNYQVDDLQSGTYNLEYQKAGYGTYKRFNVQIIAGAAAITLNGVDFLGQKSTTEISGLTVTLNPLDSTYSLGCTVSPTPNSINQRAFRIFFGKSATMSYQDYQFTPSNTWVSSTANGQITGYARSQFYNNGFTPGETVYVIAYGESIRTNTYTDPSTNKKIFPNINSNAPSNMVSFVLQ